jgi:hypothetical protein
MAPNSQPIRLVAGALVAVSLLSFGLSGYAALRYRDYAVCQANYSENLNERTRILTEVGANERAAERRRNDALDATFLDPAVRKSAAERTPEDSRRIEALFGEYLEAARALKTERNLADRARVANPVPPAPSQVCEP